MSELRTVHDLIEALKVLPQEATVHTTRPPFTGVRIIPQVDGKIGIFEPDEVPVESVASAN